MNIPKLKGKMVEKGLNVEKLAETLKIHPTSMYRKINEERITVGEAVMIKDVLALTNEEAIEIFLA